jgi:hypothetical protein
MKPTKRSLVMTSAQDEDALVGKRLPLQVVKEATKGRLEPESMMAVLQQSSFSQLEYMIDIIQNDKDLVLFTVGNRLCDLHKQVFGLTKYATQNC